MGTVEDIGQTENTEIPYSTKSLFFETLSFSYRKLVWFIHLWVNLFLNICQIIKVSQVILKSSTRLTFVKNNGFSPYYYSKYILNVFKYLTNWVCISSPPPLILNSVTWYWSDGGNQKQVLYLGKVSILSKTHFKMIIKPKWFHCAVKQFFGFSFNPSELPLLILFPKFMC